MSRTPHSKNPKGFGYDYGGRRAGNQGGGAGYGPIVKRFTHRTERRQSSQICFKAKSEGVAK